MDLRDIIYIYNLKSDTNMCRCAYINIIFIDPLLQINIKYGSSITDMMRSSRSCKLHRELR